MKRKFITLVAAAGLLAGGWLFDRVLVYRALHRGVQWQFVSAAQRGDISEMERLLQRGAHLDDVPTDSTGSPIGHAALPTAVDAGQTEAARWLVERGADRASRQGEVYAISFPNPKNPNEGLMVVSGTRYVGGSTFGNRLIDFSSAFVVATEKTVLVYDPANSERYYSVPASSVVDIGWLQQ